MDENEYDLREDEIREALAIGEAHLVPGRYGSRVIWRDDPHYPETTPPTPEQEA